MKNKYAGAAKSDTKVQSLRKLIGGAIALIAVLVGALGLYYLNSDDNGTYVEGVDYTVIEPAQRYRAGAPITVTEYFSYACIHCKNFDPSLKAWAANLPTDVELKQSPVSFSPAWELLSRAYLSLEALDILAENHHRFFTAIHDQRRQFLSAEMLADFVDGHGASKAAFLRTFNSPSVQRKFQKISTRAQAIPVSGVPTLVIADKYVLQNSLDRKGMLAVVDFLLEKERALRTGTEIKATSKSQPSTNGPG